MTATARLGSRPDRRAGAGNALLSYYADTAEQTGQIIRGVSDPGQPPAVDAGQSVRWVLLHLIKETARHAGHADIIRETLDGQRAGSLTDAYDQCLHILSGTSTPTGILVSVLGGMMTARERDDGGGRDLLRRAGDASVLILTSLADGSKHGYALIQDIKGFAGLQLGPGTLYGALDRLERMGLIEALPAEDRRQPYRITAAGVVALRAHLDSIERVTSAGRLRLGLGRI